MHDSRQCSKNGSSRSAPEITPSEIWVSYMGINTQERHQQKITVRRVLGLVIYRPIFKYKSTLTFESYKTAGTMSAVRQIWRSLVRKDKSVDKWRSILTDPSSAMLLHQQDKNVNQLQNMFQELSISGRETFASTITLLTTKICVAENEDEFSYIRAVLEVFVLYSIATLDFAWMRDSRAAYIGRQTEIMSEITFSPSQVPSPLDAGSSEGCLQLAAMREKISRTEHCRSNIIKKIVDLGKHIGARSAIRDLRPRKSIPPAQCRQFHEENKTNRASLDSYGLLPRYRAQGLRSSSSICRWIRSPSYQNGLTFNWKESIRSKIFSVR